MATSIRGRGGIGGSADSKVWGLLVFVVLLYHLYGIFIVFCILTYHFFFSRSEATRKEVLSSLAPPTLFAGLLALPLWLLYSLPSFGRHWTYDVFLFSGHTVKAMVGFLFGTMGDMTFHLLWVVPFLVVLFGLLIWDRFWMSRMAFLAILILFPVGFVFISDYRGHYWFLPRHFIWVMPLWGILTGKSFAAILARCRSSEPSAS